ncbi:hypothetical protein ABTM82_19245, partial [Acinetobacter baumannii]
MRNAFSGTCALFALAIAAPQVALAADAPAASGDAAAAPSAFGDIVVTAQRRVDTVQNTAIALTALTGEELARR